MNLPNFLIVGAPRAGTTWLQKNLREHPDIFMTKKKEIHFFDRGYKHGMEYYKTFFSGSAQYKWRGEASPSYLHKSECAKRIYETLGGDIKLIVSLRNPVDRLYSRYLNVISAYKESRSMSFEEKIRDKPEFILEGCYSTNLEEYLKYFDKKNILILLYDELEKNESLYYRKVIDFLGLEKYSNETFLNSRINSARAKKFTGKNNLYYYLGLFSKALKARNLAQYFSQKNYNDSLKMKEETRKWLLDEFYMNEIEGLIEKFNLDIEHWKKV